MDAKDRGRRFEKYIMKKLREVEGRAYCTIASGAIFNDEDVSSNMHVVQCKSTTRDVKSISIPLKEYRSVRDLASGTWRADGLGTKIGLFINQLNTGEVIISLDLDAYLDTIRELNDYKDMIAALLAAGYEIDKDRNGNVTIKDRG